MSLNGLDDPQVKEAYEVAATEPGGWFLLKYASRDEVELLGRGNGGIVELRNSIAQYEEPSPLYGFLRYRRRNVLIKYLPDGCSRLIQARVAVHFNAVCDRFSPYDTDFPITTSKELKDTKLSAACSLHTASGSTSSSTSSLRRRRLMEIAEEEEEEQREKKRQSTVNEEERSITGGPADTTELTPSQLPVILNSDLATSLAASSFASTVEPASFTGIPRPSSPAKSFDDATRRRPLYPARPDLYSYSSYTYGKPKIKLGPRPSLDVGGRPRTSAGTNFRPVSTMPNGLKLSSKSLRKGGSHDKTADQAEPLIVKEETTDALGIPLLASAIPENRPPGSGLELTRPHTSGGAVHSGMIKSNMPALPTLSTKPNTMTPEKARLMKAKKLREMRMSSQQPGTPVAANSSESSDIPEVSVNGEAEIVGTATMTEEEELPTENEGDADNPSVSNADSGLAIDASNDHGSVDTRIDSHPTSPVVSTSDIGGDSTKASSLSEATDETVEAGHDKKGSRAQLDNDDRETEIGPVVDQGPDKLQKVVTSESLQTDSHGLEDVDEAKITVCEVETAESEKEPEFEKGLPQTPSLAIPVSKFAAGLPPSQAAENEKADGADQSELALKGDGAATLENETATAVESPDSRQFAMPVSKFATREAKAPIESTASPVPCIVTPLPDSEHKAAVEESKPVNESEANDVETASIDTRPSKRKVLIDPIRTDLPDMESAQSDANFSDDDDLMEELQSATFQQAHPVTVSKSPITPVFPGSSPESAAANLGTDAAASRLVRAVSNPIRVPLLTPPDVSASSARTVSSGAAFLHKITQQTTSTDLRPKTPKIGSSISERIKALEMLSANSVSGESSNKERPSSTFFSVRKTSIREPSRSPSIIERAGSIGRRATPTPPESRESSPETPRPTRCDRSGSMASRLSVFEGGGMPRGRPESIQVTARIVRDPFQQFPKAPDLKADPTVSVNGPLELRQSLLVVDHQKADGAALLGSAQPGEGEHHNKETSSLFQRRLSKERRSQSEDRVAESTTNEFKDETEPVNRPRRRSSLTIVKDFIKDRRDSLRSAMSPSSENLALNLPQSSANLGSPAILTPSRSPSRPPSVHQNSLFPRRLSISSRRSSIDQKSPPYAPSNVSTGPLSPSLMTETSGESDGDDSKRLGSGSSTGATSPGSKSGNRASRFIRRLSNSLSSSRKNITPSISPTVAEENDAEVAAEFGGMVPLSAASPSKGFASPIVSYIGDVNVQFPDNLLWKRRTMCLDSQGFLILSTAQGVSPTVSMAATGTARDRQLQAGTIKRYHLSDFRLPYTPEMEVQELPNSVILDFIDGSGLQIACEDRAGQMNVLHILQDAHRNHASFGQ